MVINIIIHYIIDYYGFVLNSTRQKGRILCTTLSRIYRQKSKFLKIIYIKTWFKTIEDIMNSKYRDMVTDGQRHSRSGDDMMSSRYREIVTCEQETW